MVPVKITIHSLTKGTEEGPMTFVSYGTLTEKNNTVYVRYEESAVTGMEGTKTTLKWDADSLTVIRHGKYEHRQHYERGRNTSFNYVTPYLTVPMVVFTRLMTFEKGDGRWDLALDYDVDIDQKSNGSISLKIEIEEEKVSGH
ncbi:MAG: DUF1934 domain-containing protein [Acidaminococcus sp.]|jgi:uncharacterized beta-barrel protein YwiB (DUF1934 family)|nr:DUF1934 domain-containing protein [Acidaminococcus sp.]MCI2100598.1 DUF1934 domain-containing protein [Acidaminococcus sp.]MCI2114919.1 DUF1934 domain-containing protein [Acidaminococcus sp.]MCI2116945.1 DUF1934 domain-containing protein [Acidaminococcus sp.]